MNNQSIRDKNILGYRIKEARIARSYSMQELADSIGVTKQSLSKYENGLTNVSADIAFKISSILDLPIEFFMKEKNIGLEEFDEKPIFFRSLRATSNKVKESLSQNLRFLEEFYEYFNKFIDFPRFDFEGLNNNYKIGLSDNEIEIIAAKTRKKLGLGDGPIVNLTRTLEQNGIIVTRIELKTHNVDAFSNITSKGIPIIILGSDKNSAVRSRMDLAHELGHIVLHSTLSKDLVIKNHNIIEDEAKKFASAFLLPYKEFSEDLYSINLEKFIYLKRKWKVSIAGMIVRTHQLNLITDEQYVYLFKRISAKKWRVMEPLDDVIEFEKPSLLREAIDLLLENNVISVNELVNDLAFSRKEIESLCYLNPNYLGDDEQKSKVMLRLIK